MVEQASPGHLLVTTRGQAVAVVVVTMIFRKATLPLLVATYDQVVVAVVVMMRV